MYFLFVILEKNVLNILFVIDGLLDCVLYRFFLKRKIKSLNICKVSVKCMIFII